MRGDHRGAGTADAATAAATTLISVAVDGRYVAFRSSARNLVGGDTNGVDDVFVRDRVAGVTKTRASVAGNGAEGNGNSATPSISADGKHVAFQSVATDFATGADMSTPNVYVRDLG